MAVNAGNRICLTGIMRASERNGKLFAREEGKAVVLFREEVAAIPQQCNIFNAFGLKNSRKTGGAERIVRGRHKIIIRIRQQGERMGVAFRF